MFDKIDGGCKILSQYFCKMLSILRRQGYRPILKVDPAIFSAAANIVVFFCISVSCSADMTIKLWDFQGYDCIRTMHGKVFKHIKFNALRCYSLSSFNATNLAQNVFFKNNVVVKLLLLFLLHYLCECTLVLIFILSFHLFSAIKYYTIHLHILNGHFFQAMTTMCQVLPSCRVEIFWSRVVEIKQ